MTINQFKNKYGVHITTRHTGKMSGMTSLSTSALCNRYCVARANDPDSICAKCYAVNLMDRYKETAAAMARNSEILTKQIIPVNEWPLVNNRVFRLEAFGDIANEIQFINYINFARRNAKTTFALWTKNPGIIDRVLKDGYKKPRNMIVIYSSPYIDKPVNTEKYLAAYPFIDKFFTVYRKETAAAGNVNINCGARSCLTCGRCYSKRTGKEVNELLK